MPARRAVQRVGEERRGRRQQPRGDGEHLVQRRERRGIGRAAPGTQKRARLRRTHQFDRSSTTNARIARVPAVTS